jgi:hypothetical protein
MLPQIEIGVVTRPFHSSSWKNIEFRQNVCRNEHKQTNASKTEDGPEPWGNSPVMAFSDSNTPNRRLQKREGECQTNKIQPRGFPYPHGFGL